jgi:hypothetical protein
MSKTTFINFCFRFFTRNKTNRVGSDCYKVNGDHIENYLPHDLYNLNVSFRTNFEDLDRFPIQGVVVFVAENETQYKNFNDYISYFNEKERVTRNTYFNSI